MMHLTDCIGEALTIGVCVHDVQLTDRIDFDERPCKQCALRCDVAHRSTSPHPSRIHLHECASASRAAHRRRIHEVPPGASAGRDSRCSARNSRGDRLTD
ncbi:hypothetical protein, partial [Burkholderia sp.]|uniref:hypothetical protein n=1 Tax=Burkholderia sp. TaxID=36773 RepID=UPI002586F034